MDTSPRVWCAMYICDAATRKKVILFGIMHTLVLLVLVLVCSYFY